MRFSRNEIVLLPIPFTDLTSRKVRPAVIVGQAGRAGDLFVSPISSVLPNVEHVLLDGAAAGLNVPCGFKAQLATIEDRLVVKTVGRLSARDGSALDGCLRTWLRL
jgi:mRNA interferase MazF